MSGQSGSTKPTIALILQGGGALGAYHVGAVEAMQEAGYAPDWVTGISIGAFNAAIIAGNPPERRIERLTAFWESISRPDAVFEWVREIEPKLANTISYWEAVFFGQPGFFTPRYINPNLAPPGTPAAISFFDTSPVRATLGALVDFGQLNSGETRISLGATDVQSGELVFFSNKGKQATALTAEHVMASGSLPPGFPPVAIDGRQYWDGACVSNTPLQAIYDDQPQGHTIAFVIDLWSAAGHAPQTIDDVTMRQKQNPVRDAHRPEHRRHRREDRPAALLARPGKPGVGCDQSSAGRRPDRLRAYHLSPGGRSGRQQRRRVLQGLHRGTACGG